MSEENKYPKTCKHNNCAVVFDNDIECPLCAANNKIAELTGDCESLNEDLQKATVPGAGSM